MDILKWPHFNHVVFQSLLLFYCSTVSYPVKQRENQLEWGRVGVRKGKGVRGGMEWEGVLCFVHRGIVCIQSGVTNRLSRLLAEEL